MPTALQRKNTVVIHRVIIVLQYLFFCSTLFFSILTQTAFAQHPFISNQNVNPSSNCQASIKKIEVTQTFDRQAPLKSNWITLNTLPDYWVKRWGNYSDSAWYKVRWDYHCNHPQNRTPITLVIENINMAGEIYLNDEFFWKDQSLTEPLSRSWLTPRYWILPNSSLKQGENTLFIHVVGTATQKSGLGQLYLGEHKQMNAIYRHSLMEKQTLLLISLIVNLIIAIFCFMVWLFSPAEKVFKWFAYTGLAWSLYVAINLLSEPIFGLTSLTLDKIRACIFSFYTLFGCIAAWRFANKTYIKIERSIFVFYSITVVLILIVPDQYTPKLLNLIFLIGVTLFLIKCITYPFIAYQSKLKEAYILAIQYVIFIPIVINDAIFMTTLKGQILSPYVSPISTFLIGFILALRLANTTKRIQEFNKTLEISIIEARDSLRTSLNTQHQLALENARLQERIHLSQDLHDGLGGSIVRSMILLDHNDHLDKNQMMSILKLLRSDLRQVIDSGSSVSVKVPDNPILWVAPVRHRFVQLFEELDIESQWKFENKWNLPPSALQCLTLLRIAEEALTNVIKHSHATQVCVSLTETSTQYIFEISDNGVGFNPESVQLGLHVGLQSMQARVQKIGGQFNLSSITGKTTIQVILPAQNCLIVANNKTH